MLIILRINDTYAPFDRAVTYGAYRSKEDVIELVAKTLLPTREDCDKLATREVARACAEIEKWDAVSAAGLPHQKFVACGGGFEIEWFRVL